MKKLLASLLAISILMGAAQAQVGPKKPQAKQKQQMALNQINLTPAQKAQVQTIRQQEKQELKQLTQNDKMTLGEFKAKRKEIRHKYQAQFKSVLTPQQNAKLGKLRSVQHNNLLANRYRERLNKRFDQRQKLAKELNLTEDQKERMASMRESFRTKVQAVRTDKNLTQEQKRAKVQDLTKQQKEQMKTVLTQDQIQKMESHLKQQKKNAIK